MAEISISIKKLAAYCLDYAKLTTSAFLGRPVKTPKIDRDVLDLEKSILGGDMTAPSIESLPLDLLLKLDHDASKDEDEKTDEQKTREVRYKRDMAIAVSLDDINRKYLTSSYTKQIVLQTGYISFRARSIFDNGEYEKVESPLISIPVGINATDRNGMRRYQCEIKDDAATLIINSLSKYLPQASYDEIFSFIAKAEGEGGNTIPLNETFFDELWTKIVFHLRKVEALDISESPDMSYSHVTLVQRANYFLSQDLLQMIDVSDEELNDTSLSAWASDEDMSLSSEVSDDGTSELFFPFSYDKHQLKVLGAIDNRAMIVEGPPGTGKSQTISNLLVHLAANGKKVLFVSQKDQAVRGVKDKLKTLEIPFLFGYIPDRLSALHTDEDEQDSAANTLISLNKQWAMTPSKNPITSLSTLHVQHDQYARGIESERTLFHLYEQRRGLEYIAEFYKKNITSTWWSEYAENKSSIQKSSAAIIRYMNDHGEYIDQKTAAYSLLKVDPVNVQDIIKRIESTFVQTIPERPGILSGQLKSLQFKQAAKRMSMSIPTEIWRDIEMVLDSKGTKAERLAMLTSLWSYFNYLVMQQSSEVTRKSLNTSLTKAGLSQQQVDRLERLIKARGQAEIFEDLELYNTIEAKIDNVENFSANDLRAEISEIKKAYNSSVVSYVRNRILRNVEDLSANRSNKAVLARVAKSLTKSKKAYKTFDRLKSDTDNFDVMSQVLPIWMMSLDDVSRIIPMASNQFDYVIIDEASQCNIAYALPVMFRTKHTIFFGDSLQMRDTNTLFKTNEQLDALGKKHNISEYYQIKADEDSVKSVMDIASLSGFKTVTLRSHYRSPKELIGFSNDNFYDKVGRSLEVINDNIFTYKDTNRVLVNHVVPPSAVSEEESDRTNLGEVLYIKNLIADFKNDPSYDGKTIAVLTFFNDQAELLRKVIENEDVKVSTIEGIQGDERDIVIYSFVITSPNAKRRYTALSGEGGEIQKGPNEGRVNVAFSRARLQVHCVTSLTPELWPDGVWIKKYLDYVDKNGIVSTRHNSAEQHFDSKFESDVFKMLSQQFDASRYYLSTQVESCGFKIDLVITDKNTNRKIAIECDGPTHFEAGDGQVYVKDDFERQSILEVAGWHFYRISYFDWQTDNTGECKSIVKDLQDYFNVQ